MAKYEQYAEYRSTHNQWLTEIPNHWGLVALKHILSVPMTDGPHETPNFLDEGVPFVSAEAVSSGKIDFKKIRGFITEVDDKRFSQKYKPQLHDVYMIKSGATTGVTAIVETEDDFNIWSPLAAMRCKKSYDPFFLLNYLRSNPFQKSVQLSWTFGTQQNIGMSTLENLPVCVPPKLEQKKIADFLNYETAQIDTLIEKQQTLIKLLKEKRQAVISHAVTKGLNPDAPMKDSGVEWLGEVPEHWGISKLGFHTSKIGSGKTPRGGAEVYQEEGVLFLRSQNIYDDGLRIRDSESVFISELIHKEMDNTKVMGGDVLLNVTGGSIGRTCIVPDDFVEANVNQHVCIVRLPTTMRYFIAFVLKSSLIKEQIDSIQTGGNREGLNFEQISKFVICIPPEKEREDIISHIESETKKIDNILEQSNNAIQLMQERRTALISAAVTGKIDVRGWVAPE